MKLGRRLLLAAPDLAHQHDDLGLRVALEVGQDVDERGAHDGVAPDADGGGLTQPPGGELGGDLVGQGARAADQTRPVPAGRSAGGMMPTLALPGEIRPGQLGPTMRTPRERR